MELAYFERGLKSGTISRSEPWSGDLHGMSRGPRPDPSQEGGGATEANKFFSSDDFMAQTKDDVADMDMHFSLERFDFRDQNTFEIGLNSDSLEAAGWILIGSICGG